MNKRFAGRFPLALAAPALALGVSAALGQTATDKKTQTAHTATGKPSSASRAGMAQQPNGSAASANAVTSTTAPAQAAFPPDAIKFYDTQVKPILKASCYSCHEGAGASGQLEMSTRASILKGGSSGPGVSLEKPADSLILRAVHYDGRRMPPRGQLPKAQIETLTKWVNMGMPMPADPAPSGKAGGASAAVTKHGPPPVNAETMRFWSFQPVKRPTVPAVKQQTWAANPIDRFILGKLEKSGLAPAPPVGKTALLRRATYDLTGLPPTPAEVSAFLADKSPNAYEKVVDRLLASPQYGERWGRHWLDLVRYAETNSFERDDPKPFAWRYRDYVIQALNADKPYDQFIREQLAGDEMPNRTPQSLIATGYYRLGAWDDEPSDPEQARYDELDDLVATTGQVFLGLTVNCARCHDHKLDPIPQKDYYRLLSFFQGTTRYGDRGRSPELNSLRPISPLAAQQRFAQEDAAYRRQLSDVEKQITAIEDSVKKDFAPVEKEDFKHKQARIAILQKRVPALLTQEKFDRYTELSKQQDDLLKSPPRDLERALCITESPKVVATHVLMRGNPHVPGDEVQPAFPSVLAPPAPDIRKPEGVTSSGRRLALADWIASPSNPLTARVIANRVWQHHFGRGIVRSASNFGFQGDKPTHPELLDYLASELVKNEWRLKPLHRQIMLSSAYRMASTPSPRSLAKDPTNDLLSHFDMRRLDAEEVRDSILTVNGSLNPTLYGPSVYPTIPAEVLAGQSRPGYGWPVSAPIDQTRRSVYVHVKRSLGLPLLASFDMADTDATCPVRFATTQPTQALGLLNSAFINDQAQAFAAYLQKQAGPNETAQVTLALRRVMQREPTNAEITRGLRFLQTLRQKHGQTAPDALRAFCVIALNLNEFIYLD